MTVSWTRHRFSGGVLALDAANTVVLRGDPDRCFDRFDDPAEIPRFAAAATRFRSVELGGRPLAVENVEAAAPSVLAIRDAADRLFRAAAAACAIEAGHLAALLRACAAGLDGQAGGVGGLEKPFGDPSRPIRLEAALAVSAVSLLSGDVLGKLRVCPNCRWLFLDRSRNSSRRWCDMTVCGNRNKAKRHYRRRRHAVSEVFNV